MGKLIRADRIFDGRRVIEAGSVRLDDQGRIQEVGPSAELSPRGDPEVRWSGTLLPGLIDVHVHLCMSGGPDPRSELLAQPLAEAAALGTVALRAHLRAGVTTVRDLGAPGGLALALGRLVAAGRLPGPRVLAAGELLCITGGHGGFLGREVDGPWAVAAGARAQLAAGASWIKVVATGGMMTPGVAPGAPQMSGPELAAAVAEAERVGARVAAHAQGAAGVRAAVGAGVHTIEHGIWLEPDLVEEMARRRTPLVPTFSAAHGIVSGRGRGVPDFVVDKMAGAADDHVRSFQAAVAASVPILAGTDAGTPLNPHGGLAGEVAHLVAHGLDPLRALSACTAEAADALGRPDLGRLAPGAVGDLVLVEGEPDRDPTHLGRVRRVLQGGREVSLEALA